MIILYSEASGESFLNVVKWRWLQLSAVGAGVADTDLFFFLLSSMLLHLDFAAGLFFYRSPRGIAISEWKLIQSCLWCVSIVVITSLLIFKSLTCANLLSSWLCSSSSPWPSSLCPLFRISGLSLCSMHPCSIPDAETHGKDGNNRPQQLCLSNGVLWCSFILYKKKKKENSL